MIRRIQGILLAVALCTIVAPVYGIDGMAVEAGRGNGTDMARVAVQWDWGKRWFQGANWHLGGYWDLGLGHWKRDALPGQNGHLTEVGLTPVFRFQRNDLTGPYAELAVGIHVLSRTSIGDKRLSTQFQFGDHLGIGYRFGAKGAYDLSYRYQHLSNGDIKKPNDGLDVNQIRLQYRF